MERILVKNLQSAYGNRQVLSDVNLAVQPSEAVALVGANGCGKTTLLSILAGIRKKSGGRIFFDGQEAEKKLFVTYTGYVPQESILIEELSVEDNLLLWWGSKSALREALQNGLLPQMGIPDICSLRVGKLSVGMKKKVSIACALAGEPPILLLDEPGAALDLPTKIELVRYLQAYKAQGGTIVLATHEENELDFCDSIYLLKNGRMNKVDPGLRGEALYERIR